MTISTRNSPLAARAELANPKLTRGVPSDLTEAAGKLRALLDATEVAERVAVELAKD